MDLIKRKNIHEEDKEDPDNKAEIKEINKKLLQLYKQREDGINLKMKI